MRIAFYSDNFYPELSGITDTIITTGKELHRRGHEVMYVAPSYGPREYAVANRQYPLVPQDDIIDDMKIARLPSVGIPLSPTGQSRLAFATGASLAEVKKFKPDVIHTQSPYGVGLEAAKVARRLRVPLVGTNHTDITDFFPPGMRTLMRMWDAHYYNKCVFVSAPYERLIGRMREVGFIKEGRAIPNPADLHEFLPPSDAERADHRKAFGFAGPVILYAGRLGVEKNVDVMVRAMPALLREFKTLTLVCTGHGAARAALERLAQTLGIGKSVRFTGYLSRATLPHAYKAADLFGMTSTSDSQSLALMQAYSSGLPAVCTRARGLPDFVPPNVGFLIEPNNPAAFAEAAGRLLRDEGLRRQMGREAVEYAKKFTPAHIADLWEEVYRSVIRQK